MPTSITLFIVCYLSTFLVISYIYTNYIHIGIILTFISSQHRTERSGSHTDIHTKKPVINDRFKNLDGTEDTCGRLGDRNSHRDYYQRDRDNRRDATWRDTRRGAVILSSFHRLYIKKAPTHIMFIAVDHTHVETLRQLCNRLGACKCTDLKSQRNNKNLILTQSKNGKKTKQIIVGQSPEDAPMKLTNDYCAQKAKLFSNKKQKKIASGPITGASPVNINAFTQHRMGKTVINDETNKYAQNINNPKGMYIYIAYTHCK